jgi:DNA-binding beta-propeller fold protein YncE
MPVSKVTSPHYRNRQNRAVRWLCVLALGIVSVALAQPVPDTILLPDSLGPLKPPYHLAFGSSTDNIYVASESSDIIVVDGSLTGNFQRIKRIDTGTPVGGALLVSQHNRLYCSYPQQGRIGIIDCATNSAVGSVLVGSRPTMLCYSSGTDKLYCGDTIDRTISVIDCGTNAVLQVIPVGYGLVSMISDASTSKLYAGTRDALLAISCVSDSIVSTISSIKWARSLCLNQRRQKLYMTARNSRIYHDTIYVVSTQSDSVIAALPCLDDSMPRLACNEATDRLYVPTNDGINRSYMWEYDCAADTLIRNALIGVCLSSVDMVCDTVRNKLFCLYLEGGGAVYTFDCATLSIASIHDFTDPVSGPLGFDPGRHRLMCTCWYDGEWVEGSFEVFNYENDTTYTKAAVPLKGWLGTMWRASTTGNLYYRWSSGAGEIDERTNRVVAHSYFGGAREVAYSPTSNKFYFETFGRLGVVDGATGRLLKVLRVGDDPGHGRLCWSPDGNKVYFFAIYSGARKCDSGARKYVAVVDCSTDSVVRTIGVSDLVSRLEYLDNGRVLCYYGSSLVLIDCLKDSVVVDSGIGKMYEVTHSGDGEKLYAVFNRRLEVRSSRTLSLLSTINWAYGWSDNGGFLAYSDSARKLYWFADGDTTLVISGTGDTVVARLKDSIVFGQTCLDHTGRYLFCISSEDRNLSIYDAQSDSLVAVYRDLPDAPVCITPNPEQGSIYVGCRDVILVFPDALSGVQEGQSQAPSRKPQTTVVRGVLGVTPSLLFSSYSLLSTDGRKVMDLVPGANDVRALAPGVYFVRSVAREPSAVSCSKVVITR